MDLLPFDDKTKDFRFPYAIGRPVTINNGVLKLSTQMYYEGIPLSVMNTGVHVEFYKDYRKKEKFGEGTIASKYFVRAKKDDWKIEKEINNSKAVEVKVDLKLNKSEKAALELGILPLSMDDKWFGYCQENEFHFYRSWTGIEMIKGKLIRSDSNENEWSIHQVYLSREWYKVSKGVKDPITDLLKSLISLNLKRCE